MTRSFGNLLRKYRVAAGLTQEMLAERAGMSLAAIGKLERGSRQRPYRSTVGLLADALALSGDERHDLERAAHRAPAGEASSEHDAGAAIHLPVHFSSFVGREHDLQKVAELLARHRLVTLVGAGGVGKTRLAIRAAEQFIAARPVRNPFDGVWFVDFSAVTDGEMVAMVLAEAIGAGHCHSLDALVSYLQSQRFLLLFDNCEHVLSAVATAANSILAGCPDGRILATSRQALSLAGEHIYHVPPLSLVDALALFKDRAEAADSRFELTETVVPAVTEICRRVEGIALAIELAAARTNAFSPASIAAQIGEQFSLLAGARTSLPRHQTMRALFDWSYDLLDEHGQELFRRASIFAGGFTLELLSALYPEAEQSGIPRLLASLVDMSLVQCDILVEPTRYRLLEPIRQYARERLRECGEYNEVARSHALALLALAEDFDARRELVSDQVWDAYIGHERDNLSAAFEWALGPHGDTTLGARLAGSRAATWSGFRTGEVRKWIAAAVASCNESTSHEIRASLAISAARTAVIFGPAWGPDGNPQARVDACRRALTLQSPDDIRAVATTKFWLGVALQTIGRFDEAESILREARSAAQSIGLQQEYTAATNSLASVRFGAGDLQEARELIAEALRRAEAAGSDRIAADARASLAEITFALGDVAQAQRLNEKTIAFFRSPTNQMGLIMTLSNAASYLIVLGRYTEAREAALEALRRSLAIGTVSSAFWAMQHLAAVAIFQDPRREDDAGLRRAAQLLGFIDATTKRREIPRYHSEQYEYDRIFATLREAFGDDQLAMLMATGATWSEDQALAESFALATT